MQIEGPVAILHAGNEVTLRFANSSEALAFFNAHSVGRGSLYWRGKPVSELTAGEYAEMVVAVRLDTGLTVRRLPAIVPAKG